MIIALTFKSSVGRIFSALEASIFPFSLSLSLKVASCIDCFPVLPLPALTCHSDTCKLTIIPVRVDVIYEQFIADTFEGISSQYTHIDTLTNNAGRSFDSLMCTDPFLSSMCVVWEKFYLANITFTQVFATTFMPLLLASNTPHLLFVTSALASLTTAEEEPGFNKGCVGIEEGYGCGNDSIVSV